MQLLWLHPEVAGRDCGSCQKYRYSKQGTVELTTDVDASGNRIKAPRLRGAKQLPPCRTEEGCPRGTPENPASLTPANEAAYRHYTECKAIGSFPNDGWVRWQAGIFYRAEQMCERIEQRDNAMILARASMNSTGI